MSQEMVALFALLQSHKIAFTFLEVSKSIIKVNKIHWNDITRDVKSIV